jgi:hypothetical protein
MTGHTVTTMLVQTIPRVPGLWIAGSQFKTHMSSIDTVDDEAEDRWSNYTDKKISAM